MAPQPTPELRSSRYENEFKFPAGDVGEAASKAVSGSAEREANDSLTRFKQLAEA